MSLDTRNRLADPDRVYRALIDAHRGLSDEESAALNTRLVLVLANQIGDVDVIEDAISAAKGVVQKSARGAARAAETSDEG